MSIAVANTMNIEMNEHVLAFIERICDENEYDNSVFFEIWNSAENQEKVGKILTKTTKGSKGKKIKDPNKPKKSKSAYLFFCDKNRNIVKSDLGDDAKATEVTSELGVRWNNLKDSTKQADKKLLQGFTEQATKDKERYTEEMANYSPPSDEELLKNKKSSRKRKDPNAPKRGKSK
jgi:hypothetical protein